MKRISRPFSRTTACSVSITGKRRQSEKRPEKLPSPNHQNPSSRLERPFYVVLYKKRPSFFASAPAVPSAPRASATTRRGFPHAARIYSQHRGGTSRAGPYDCLQSPLGKPPVLAESAWTASRSAFSSRSTACGLRYCARTTGDASVNQTLTLATARALRACTVRVASDAAYAMPMLAASRGTALRTSAGTAHRLKYLELPRDMVRHCARIYISYMGATLGLAYFLFVVRSTSCCFSSSAVTEYVS